MPLHIKDETTTSVVRRLAAARGLTLTDAIREACVEALRRDERARPVGERLSDIHAAIRAARGRGQGGRVVDDKAFFDAEWERGL
jgi:antitoxin VapB